MNSRGRRYLFVAGVEPLSTKKLNGTMLRYFDGNVRDPTIYGYPWLKPNVQNLSNMYSLTTIPTQLETVKP